MYYLLCTIRKNYYFNIGADLTRPASRLDPWTKIQFSRDGHADVLNDSTICLVPSFTVDKHIELYKYILMSAKTFP